MVRLQIRTKTNSAVDPNKGKVPLFGAQPSQIKEKFLYLGRPAQIKDFFPLFESAQLQIKEFFLYLVSRADDRFMHM